VIEMPFGQRFFAENLQYFAPDPKAQPEKYNLYNGLHCVSEGLDKLNKKVDSIENTLLQITEDIDNIKRRV
jgi:uncharacterized phage infection (PIP) family protein YhgE